MFIVQEYLNLLKQALRDCEENKREIGEDGILLISIEKLEKLIHKLETGEDRHSELELPNGARYQYESDMSMRATKSFFQAHLYWKTKGGSEAY
jgi:hypothetical protein